MAILLTYPEDKFEDEMLIELYNWNPIFLPLRRIKFVPWTKERYGLVNESEAVVITSMLAVESLLKSDISIDKPAVVFSIPAARLL